MKYLLPFCLVMLAGCKWPHFHSREDTIDSLVVRGRARIDAGDTVNGMADIDRSIKMHPTVAAFVSKFLVEHLRDSIRSWTIIWAADSVISENPAIKALLAEYYIQGKPIPDSCHYFADYAWKLPGKLHYTFYSLMNAYLFLNDFPMLIKVADSLNVYFPKDAYPYNNKGWAEFNLGNVDPGKEDILHSLQLDPTNAWAYRNLSIVYKYQHMTDSFCFFIHKAQEMDSAKKYKKDIDSLIRLCKLPS